MESKLAKLLPKKNSWMILLLVGVLLVVIAIPTKTDSEEGSLLRYDETDQNTTDMEKRLENLLEQMQGVGEVHTMITYQKDDSVEGIVIIAEGGGDAVIVRNITEVVRALFSVDSHKIKVIEKNQNN
ncbi:MAG: hypothetical protein J6J72_04395 [Tyzzerella sp.]|nr:hypothetical protein [Tyzzerella sp.]